MVGVGEEWPLWNYEDFGETNLKKGNEKEEYCIKNGLKGLKIAIIVITSRSIRGGLPVEMHNIYPCYYRIINFPFDKSDFIIT